MLKQANVMIGKKAKEGVRPSPLTQALCEKWMDTWQGAQLQAGRQARVFLLLLSLSTAQ
jgi:hypothetical protein